jgi:DHA1 family inner membrane transport protein
MPIALLALAIASFCIGTSEFVIMGLLPDLARDLGVTIPQAGLLVTGYALGVVFGGPLIAAAVVNVPRKPALIGMASMFVLGNLLCALAPNYAILMLARVVTAFCHGSFFGISSVVAADIVAPGKRAQAIALVFGGLTLANVLGVPFGTALGNTFGWRSTFFAVTIIGVVATIAIALLVPREIPMRPANLRGEMRALVDVQVVLPMATSVFASASLFSVFTYITPLLERVAGMSPTMVTYALLVFGAGLTVGNALGGRLADWKLMPSLIGVGCALITLLVVFAFAEHAIIAAFALLFIWGILAFALVPLLQLRIVDAAAAAPNLASTFNQGAFNLGNASGAWLGGVALKAGVDYARLPWLGAGLAAVALATMMIMARLHQPQHVLSHEAAL